MSFDEDDENASQDELSEDNDENMEDADEGDVDADADADGDQEIDGEGEDGDADGDGEDDDPEAENDAEGEGENEEEEEEMDSPTQNRQGARRNVQSPRTLTNGTKGPPDTAAAFTTPSPRPQSLSTLLPFYPSMRPEAVSASTYDIVPTIAAPHSTSINSIAATPDMRWVFTGGTDGYIRKFNWIDSANGKLMLTVAQRHPFVDSVTKAGVLLSYWENEEVGLKTPKTRLQDEGMNLSPVYSLAVQNQGLWLLSGLESGGINLQTVRHSEGTRVTTLRQHTSAVSVLVLAPDEQSVISGSWDNNIHDWDLNTGQIRRSYLGSTGQISSIEMRPLSSVPVPKQQEEEPVANGTFSSNNARPVTNGTLLNGNTASASSNIAVRQNSLDAGSQGEDAPGSPEFNSLFGDDDPPMVNGDDALGMPSFGDDDDVDEFSRAIENSMQQDAEDALNADIDMTDVGGPVLPTDSLALIDEAATAQVTNVEALEAVVEGIPNSTDDSAAEAVPNGLPNTDLFEGTALTNGIVEEQNADDAPPTSNTTFLSSSFDGAIRIWDSRMPDPIARIRCPRNTPPFCMSACWSPDGNFIYAGRRNNAVDEYSIRTSLREPRRTFKFPAGSGAVSAVKAMPNGRNLVCASHDILRLYDLQHDAAPAASRGHSVVPFLIIPGHRTGVISQLYLDPTGSFLISTAGNRGWEGASTEVMLGYEIGYGGRA